jgi:porphobilinogen synthase
MSMRYPTTRSRRLRASERVRSLVRETDVRTKQMIQPMFVVPGSGVSEAIASMPGQSRYSVDRCVEFGRRVFEAGVGGVLLFGVPETKDKTGSSAYDDDGIIQRAVRSLREACPELLIMTDVCLCAYTSHGHCGVLRGDEVDNDATLELLGKVAVSHAARGADFVAPSDMMDGRVGSIRCALDDAGYAQTGIMSYAVKFASAFFGPFREAADSSPSFGDRRGYQMDPANRREAVKLAVMGESEGADILMVKPALPYLDVVSRVRAETVLPLAAYQVSGEYAMIEAAAERGWLDRDRAIDESLLAIRRAGADMLITYYALEIAQRSA